LPHLAETRARTQQRVYYVREDIMKRAISVRARQNAPPAAAGCTHAHTHMRLTRDHVVRLAQVARENLISLGVCIGKFTHSNKFILTIGALDILAQHAKYKARSRASATQPLACLLAARAR
jgi:hypothetical protein